MHLEELQMNKTALVAAVAAKAGISKKDADAAVAAVFASVTDAMADLKLHKTSSIT